MGMSGPSLLIESTDSMIRENTLNVHSKVMNGHELHPYRYMSATQVTQDGLN